jgi:Na+-driven multidrug efflux pump
MYATAISVWLVRLPLGWVFGIPLNLGLSGVYVSNVIDAAVRAGANYWRFRNGRWEQGRV